jgi:hypothetical protein
MGGQESPSRRKTPHHYTICEGKTARQNKSTRGAENQTLPARWRWQLLLRVPMAASPPRLSTFATGFLAPHLRYVIASIMTCLTPFDEPLDCTDTLPFPPRFSMLRLVFATAAPPFEHATETSDRICWAIPRVILPRARGASQLALSPLPPFRAGGEDVALSQPPSTDSDGDGGTESIGDAREEDELLTYPLSGEAGGVALIERGARCSRPSIDDSLCSMR